MGGTHRITVSTGQPLPELDWSDEIAELPDAWPYVGPTWLAANERAMPEVTPWHTIARRDQRELAVLPGYLLTAPPAVDHDPRTYLGWQPPTGDSVCCGVELAGGQSAEVDALGVDTFFPALLIGSPLGYRTEVAYNFWTPHLFATMIDQLVPAAYAAGVRSVVAPWVPDRTGNAALVSALTAAGGHARPRSANASPATNGVRRRPESPSNGSTARPSGRTSGGSPSSPASTGRRTGPASNPSTSRFC